MRIVAAAAVEFGSDRSEMDGRELLVLAVVAGQALVGYSLGQQGRQIGQMMRVAIEAGAVGRGFVGVAGGYPLGQFDVAGCAEGGRLIREQAYDAAAVRNVAFGTGTRRIGGMDARRRRCLCRIIVTVSAERNLGAVQQAAVVGSVGVVAKRTVAVGEGRMDDFLVGESHLFRVAICTESVGVGEQQARFRR